MNEKRMIIFFNLIKACHESLLLYPAGNPMVAKQLENFIKVYPEFADGEGRVSFTMDRGSLLLNGQILASQLSNSPGPRWFVAHCLDRKITQLTFEPGLELNELETLFELLRKELNEFPNADAAPDMLIQAHVQSILINQLPLDHTFSSLPVSNAMPVLPSFKPPSGFPAPPMLAQIAAEPEPAIAPDPGLVPIEYHTPQSPNFPGTDAVPLVSLAPGATLFVSDDDRDREIQTVIKFIQGRKLNLVALKLTRFRKELTADSRQTRETAFSYYHVVVFCLVQERQNKPLFSILKSLPADFQTCVEEDLFALHLETLTEMLVHFKNSAQMAPLIYGLDILAALHLGQLETNQKKIEAKLTDVLGLKLLEEFLANEDSTLTPLLDSLFKRHGRGLLRPLLDGLYASENRNIRKKLLEMLAAMGPLIYPTLTAELRTAISTNQPWYVKRNLVMLLSAQPPPEVAGLIASLTGEEQHRFLSLVIRCVFKLNTEAAIALGQRLIGEARGTQLKLLLDQVAKSGRREYVPTMINLFQNAPSDRVKIDCIGILGKLAGSESLAYLIQILDKTSIFGSKTKSEYRVAAARALAQAATPKALMALTKYSRDGDREVRAIAKKALAD